MSFKVTTLDFYDDRGDLLCKLVPHLEIPEFVKQASSVQDDTHPELFAVVLNEGGQLLKKFPTTDPGNTWLSLTYFQETRDLLPLEAQKVAAARLSQACAAFGIQTPEWLDSMSKADDHSGFLVDVTGKVPPVKVASESERTSVEYCIIRADGSQYFPLSDANSVATALQYFDENHRQLQPRERREYAVKVASAAAKGALPLPESVESYAGSSLGENWEGHILARYKHLQDVGASPDICARLVKIAALAPRVAPEKLASALEQFDLDTKISDMWDRWISDPWASVFEKQAKGYVPHTKSFNLPDGSYVSQEDLMLLADKERGQLTVQFGHEFANAFCKDPMKIFQSLPLPQKKELARMAATRM